MATLKPPSQAQERRAQARSDRRVAVPAPAPLEPAAARRTMAATLLQAPELMPARVEQLLADSDPEVRLATLAVLDSLHHPAVGQWLIGVIGRDSDVKVCACAIDLLGELGDHTAVAPLRAVKARFPREVSIQFAADVALGLIE